jgi:DNA ligase 4
LSIVDIDALLDELSSYSAFSHVSIRSFYTAETRRDKLAIFRELYRSLSPIEASFLTQIILKDLRPLLYPLPQTHFTTALLRFNSASIEMLTKEHAMLTWDPSRWMLKMYRVRSNLDDVAAWFKRAGSYPNVDTPQVGIPIEVISHNHYYPWITIDIHSPRYPSLRRVAAASRLFISS